MYFIPESKLESDITSGAKYAEWAKAGYVTVCEGNDIDLSVVADWFYSLYEKYDIKLWKCGYDQKFAKDWIRNTGDVFRLQKLLGHTTLEMTRQYVNMFNEDLKQGFEDYNPLDRLKKASSRTQKVSRNDD